MAISLRKLQRALWRIRSSVSRKMGRSAPKQLSGPYSVEMTVLAVQIAISRLLIQFEDYIREKGDDEKKKEVLTISKLRAMMPQSTLDLHGMTVEETDKAVHEFIEDCHKHGLRKISIITGKGLHSEDGVGVLRQYVSTLLDSSSFVSEKANAPISAGGAGAFWIIHKA